MAIQDDRLRADQVSAEISRLSPIPTHTAGLPINVYCSGCRFDGRCAHLQMQGFLGATDGCCVKSSAHPRSKQDDLRSHQYVAADNYSMARGWVESASAGRPATGDVMEVRHGDFQAILAIRQLSANSVIDIWIIPSLQEESMLLENIVKSQKDPNKLVGMEWCVGCLTAHLQWITRLQLHHCKPHADSWYCQAVRWNAPVQAAQVCLEGQRRLLPHREWIWCLVAWLLIRCCAGLFTKPQTPPTCAATGPEPRCLRPNMVLCPPCMSKSCRSLY